MKEYHKSIAVTPERQLQVVETPYGIMKFSTQAKAYDFYCTIRQWGEFHTRRSGWRALPGSLVEAVTYHLAYVTGGFAEVEKLFVIYTAATVMHEQKQAALKEAQRADIELRYAIAALAPRDSALYREHHDMTYYGYKWGW